MYKENDFFKLYEISETKIVFSEEDVDNIGKLIDCADLLGKEEGLRKAIRVAKRVLETSKPEATITVLHYFIANAYSGLRNIAFKASSGDLNWNNECLEKEILHFREALISKGINELDIIRQSQILVNLGTSFRHLGRITEAVEYYDLAIELEANLGMSKGNKGIALYFYAKHVENYNVRNYILKCAYSELKYAINCDDQNCYTEAKSQFKEHANHIEIFLGMEYLSEYIDVSNESLGNSGKEICYRKWCIDNRLMLNHLNDLGSISIAATDSLTISNFIASGNKAPAMIGLLNQIKQEFTTSRFLLYKGLNSSSAGHYADQDILMSDTYDNPVYSMSLEFTRIAFKNFFSVLDRIAFWLCKYFDLNIQPSKIKFSTFWYKGQIKTNGVSKKIIELQNWPLLGLFWLSKDLFEDKNEFKNIIEPDSKELREIRNHLEHKYLKIHETPIKDNRSDIPNFTFDKWAKSIERNDFEKKALKISKIARSAIVYLVLILNYQEKMNSKNNPPKEDLEIISVPQITK